MLYTHTETEKSALKHSLRHNEWVNWCKKGVSSELANSYTKRLTTQKEFDFDLATLYTRRLRIDKCMCSSKAEKLTQAKWKKLKGCERVNECVYATLMTSPCCHKRISFYFFLLSMSLISLYVLFTLIFKIAISILLWKFVCIHKLLMIKLSRSTLDCSGTSQAIC